MNQSSEGFSRVPQFNTSSPNPVWSIKSGQFFIICGRNLLLIYLNHFIQTIWWRRQLPISHLSTFSQSGATLTWFATVKIIRNIRYNGWMELNYKVCSENPPYKWRGLAFERGDGRRRIKASISGGLRVPIQSKRPNAHVSDTVTL